MSWIPPIGNRPPSGRAIPSRLFASPLPNIPDMKRSVAAALIASVALSASIHAQRGGNAASPFKFQFLGPAAGGRFASIAGVAGDLKTWYLGAASGGVWKSVDSGSTFVPVFD